MTITIELPPDIEAGLAARAAEQGLTLREYLRKLLQDQMSNRRPGSLSPAERATLWRESAKDVPRTPPLSDDAVSRESFYEARG